MLQQLLQGLYRGVDVPGSKNVVTGKQAG